MFAYKFTYEKNGRYHAIVVLSNSEKDAKAKFSEKKNNEIIGIAILNDTEYQTAKAKGMPIM